jgi:hypothetical protein
MVEEVADIQQQETGAFGAHGTTPPIEDRKPQPV